jgi:hypothetical protein
VLAPDVVKKKRQLSAPKQPLLATSTHIILHYILPAAALLLRFSLHNDHDIIFLLFFVHSFSLISSSAVAGAVGWLGWRRVSMSVPNF